jgi:hypothetical protein
MQKPPETRRLLLLAALSHVLQQNGCDDQNLGGDRDDTCRRRFDDTHVIFLPLLDPFRSRSGDRPGSAISQLQ